MTLDMTAYKRFHLRSDGTLGSLFVNRRAVLPVGAWLDAETTHPHPGLAHRPAWPVYSILADDAGLSPLNSLKDARAARNEARGRVPVNDKETHETLLPQD